MIPSTDTYLQQQIKAGLKFFLSPENRNLLKEVLTEMDSKAAKRFIQAYAQENSDPISVIFEMPQEKVDLRLSVFIGLRDGTETNTSIGNIEGTFEYDEGDVVWEPEVVELKTEGYWYYFELSREIGQIDAIEELQMDFSDAYIEGKRFYFGSNTQLSDDDVFLTVHYTPLEDGESSGIISGFTVDEAYSVTAMSTNMDMVRCLDLLIKSILIVMRSNAKEQLYYSLQNIQFGQPDPQLLKGTNEDSDPQLLYARENMVSYTITYGVPSSPFRQLSEILIAEGGGVFDGS